MARVTWPMFSRQWALKIGLSQCSRYRIVVYRLILCRCFIPGCDKNLASFEADHVNFTIPLDISGKLKKCERFLWRNNTNDSLSCSAGQFEGIKTSLCEEFIFKDEEISIAKEVMRQ